jgi:hypothetical protein
MLHFHQTTLLSQVDINISRQIFGSLIERNTNVYLGVLISTLVMYSYVASNPETLVSKNIIICQNKEEYYLKSAVTPSPKFIDMELLGRFSVKFILKKELKCKVTLQIHNLSYTKNLWI